MKECGQAQHAQQGPALRWDAHAPASGRCHRGQKMLCVGPAGVESLLSRAHSKTATQQQDLEAGEAAVGSEDELHLEGLPFPSLSMPIRMAFSGCAKTSSSTA